jgi:NADPH-ferrihemoprotein reductase
MLGAFSSVKVICFSDFDAKKHFKDTNEINLMCVASHYTGDPTDNTVKFYEWVEAQTGKPLSKMSYGLFGLGDSSYENYQAVGRYFDTRLVALGATRLVPKGEGNSQFQKTEDQFDEWKKDLWKSLILKYPSIEFRTKVLDQSSVPLVKLEFSDQ